MLRVTQPRGPCYKLNAAMDDPTAVRTMARSGLSGFYLAVDVPGSLQTGQAFEVIAGPREMPVMTLFKANRADRRRPVSTDRWRHRRRTVPRQR